MRADDDRDYRAARISLLDGPILVSPSSDETFYGIA
jgi:hypothetical protein